MTSERALWRRVRDAIGPLGHVVRVENGVGVGTPDVEYCLSGATGWLELKIARVSKRPETAVSIPHFTREQRIWMRERCNAGGRAGVLLQLGSVYVLFRGDNDSLGYLGKSLSYAGVLTAADAGGADLSWLVAELRG